LDCGSLLFVFGIDPVALHTIYGAIVPNEKALQVRAFWGRLLNLRGSGKLII
jgi:hypothetical protein